MTNQNETIVTDVRITGEYNEGHIPSGVNIHTDQMGNGCTELNKDDNIAIVCRTVHRSSLAGGILK